MCEFRKCVCHETIKNLCFIFNSDRTEYFIIGNCCIKSFIKANRGGPSSTMAGGDI